MQAELTVGLPKQVHVFCGIFDPKSTIVAHEAKHCEKYQDVVVFRKQSSHLFYTLHFCMKTHQRSLCMKATQLWLLSGMVIRSYFNQIIIKMRMIQ